MKNIGSLTVEAFDALALLYVYHWHDLAYPAVKTPKKRNDKLRIAQDHGLLCEFDSIDDDGAAQVVMDLYNETMTEYLESVAPDGWEVRFDYWGARCLSNATGWSAPRTGTWFSGESSGHFAAFDSALALRQYTEEFIESVAGRLV